MAIGIAEIIILGLFADWAFRRIKIPGFMGLLLVGILLGPSCLKSLDPSLIAIGTDLHLIALIVILLRVGFELNRTTLHKVGGRVILLAFIPAILEGTAITLVGPWLLGLSYVESAMLGSIVAAVSPAVVVPMMLDYKRKRMGTDKFIPNLVMASSSLDNIFVIVVNSIIIGFYINSDVNIAWQIASVPLSLILGIAGGLVIGIILYKVFNRLDPRATKRVLLIIAMSILLVRFQNVFAVNFPFSGFVSAMAIGYIILEKREHMAHEISAKLGKIWIFAEIILFSLVGAQADIGLAWQIGAMGIAVIAIGLTARFVGVFISLIKSDLNMKERFFIAVAYSPKATVQAAIGAAPLLAMRSAGMDTAAGELILAVSVLSIIITAPLGAWGIKAVGNRVLKVSK